MGLLRRAPEPSNEKRHLLRSSTIRQQVSLPCQLPERTTLCVSPKTRRPIFFTGTKARESVGRFFNQRLAAPIKECSRRAFVVPAGNWSPPVSGVPSV